MKVTNDIRYGEDPLQAYDSYISSGKEDAPVIIHFHGGCLNGGEKKPHKYVDELVSLGYDFYDCNYRLLPKVTKEDILQDCATAVFQITKSIKAIEKRRLYIAGDSAGGWITMMLSFRPQFFKDAGVDPSLISGYVFDDPMPIVDFANAEHFKEITDLLENPDCPLYYLNEKTQCVPMYLSTFGDSIPYFPAYAHLVAGTLHRLGFSHLLRFSYFPHLPHCGNFERKTEDGHIPYVAETHAFYEWVKNHG